MSNSTPSQVQLQLPWECRPNSPGKPHLRGDGHTGRIHSNSWPNTFEFWPTTFEFWPSTFEFGRIHSWPNTLANFLFFCFCIWPAREYEFCIKERIRPAEYILFGSTGQFSPVVKKYHLPVQTAGRNGPQRAGTAQFSPVVKKWHLPVQTAGHIRKPR